MADTVINANLESVILTSLARANKTSLEYQLKKNYPNLSKQKVQLSPAGAAAVTGTDISSQISLFTLPAYGIITDLLFQATLATSGNNNPAIVGDTNRLQSTQGGLCLFSSVQLLSNNKVVCTNTDGYLRVRSEIMNPGKSLSAKWRSRFFSTDGVTLVTVWSNNSVVTYTPFYCSFFERPENYLDLAFCQQLQVQVTYNTYTNMGLVAAITSATTTLWMSYINLQADELAKLRALNFNPASTYVALGYDVYQETAQITDSTTSTVISSQCQYASFATHVFIKKRAYNQLVPITTLTVTMGGRVLYQTIPAFVLLKDIDEMSGGNCIEFDQVNSATIDTSASSTLNIQPLVNWNRFKPITMWWGVENCREYNSGAISLHNVTNFQVTINYASSSSFDWYMVNEYWTLVNVNPADGAVTVSISA